MNKYIKLTICIVIPLLAGAIGGIATASSVKTWYTTLNKPFFNPPSYLFGPVWTSLYLLMGISLYLIIQSTKNDIQKKCIRLFGIQLVLNIAWSFLFFGIQNPALAFAEIILLWLSILLMIINFYKVSTSAAYLQIPYLLWVSFASILNGSIWLIN
jgi:translocator protein